VRQIVSLVNTTLLNADHLMGILPLAWVCELSIEQVFAHNGIRYTRSTEFEIMEGDISISDPHGAAGGARIAARHRQQ
jgi:long-subunit acyl-CoA synthetase (AMP-forming)